MFGLERFVNREPIADENISGSVEATIFSFQGRIPRSAFWKRTLYATLIFGAAEFGLDYLSKRTEESAAALVAIVLGLVIAAHVFFLIAQGAKRLQDLNQPAWLLALNATVVLIPVFIYWLGFKKGTEGPNRYGMDPFEGEHTHDSDAVPWNH